MDKQQFDHIDNRIRQAADEISVPLNEEAWKMMEVKLDNEFNKDRRRGIIWWWFSFMLVGIAALGIYVYNSISFPSKKIAGNSSLINNSASINKKAVSKIDSLKNDHTEKHYPQKTGSFIQHDKTVLINETPDNQINSPHNNRLAKLNPEKIKINSEPVTTNNFIKEFKKNKHSKLTVSSANVKSETPIAAIKLNKSKKSYNPINELHNNYNNKEVESSDNLSLEPGRFIDLLPSAVSTENVKAPEAVNQNDSLKSPDSTSKKSTQVKLDGVSSKGFYFLAAAGGEATGIKNISVKDTKAVYGVGIGYRFNKRLSLQTGFYFGKKVYAAGAADYKVKPGSYIAKFISAEAECYIYDIPVTLRYNALQKRMGNFYVATGLSSFILKRETYDMHFFNPAGMYRHMPYTYKHNVAYLSVFNISMGYEHKLSSSLFLLAEPYLKVPLSGLGEGSVKLNSAGLQLGVRYQPLKKKK